MNKLLLAICTMPLCLSTMNVLADEEGGFIKDSKLTFSARNMWLDHDMRQGSGSAQSREWGQGFVLDFKSGFTQGFVGFGFDAIGMASLRLDGGGRAGKAGVDRGTSQMFPLRSNGKPEHGAGSFGIAPKIRISKTVAQYGSTFKPMLPVVVNNDGRLLPQIYQGGMITSDELKDFTFVGGKLDHAKGRNSTDMRPLSVTGAGKGVGSNRFYFGGVDYRVTKDLKLQYYYANLRDFYRQHFAGLQYKLAMPVGVLSSDLRYFYSDSDGKNSSSSGRMAGYKIKGYKNDGEVNNRAWQAVFNYAIDSHTFTAGYQAMSGHSIFPYLDQGSSTDSKGGTAYLIGDSIIGKFINPGERTWVAGYAYNFKELGLPGLSASVKYLRGTHIRSADDNHTEWERDIGLSYKIQEGTFKGLEFAYKYGMFRSDLAASNNENDNRLIVNYTFVFDKF